MQTGAMKNYRNASRWTVLFWRKPAPRLFPHHLEPTPVESGWGRNQRQRGIAVYSKKILRGSPLVAFRGVGVIDAPVAKVMSVLLRFIPQDGMGQLRAVEARDVRQISPSRAVSGTITAQRLGRKDRDFVFNAKVEIDEPGKFLTLTIRSVDEASMPENDCCVRASLIEPVRPYVQSKVA